MTDSGIDGIAVKRLAKVAIAQPVLIQEGKNIAAKETGHNPGTPVLPASALSSAGSVGPGQIAIPVNQFAPNATGVPLPASIPLYSPALRQLPVDIVTYSGEMTAHDAKYSEWHKP
jgi:hypothetical protein